MPLSDGEAESLTTKPKIFLSPLLSGGRKGMKESFLFLLLDYALTQPSPKGRGRLPVMHGCFMRHRVPATPRQLPHHPPPTQPRQAWLTQRQAEINAYRLRP